jgi:hypothetical protein
MKTPLTPGEIRLEDSAVAGLSLHSWLYAAARWMSKLFLRFCLELRGAQNRSCRQIKENHRDGASSRWKS